MLERSEASKTVVLVITIMKEILDFSVDRWFALLRMTERLKMTIAAGTNDICKSIKDYGKYPSILGVYYVKQVTHSFIYWHNE